MKANEQYFPVVLFIMPYKVALTFDSVDEILKCNYSNESDWGVLSTVLFIFPERSPKISPVLSLGIMIVKSDSKHGKLSTW